MGLVLVTGPGVEPVELAEAKLHLGVTHTRHDSLITALIVAARTQCEKLTYRAFIETEFKLTLDEFPYSDPTIELLRPPLLEVSELVYTDAAGDEQDLVEDEDFVVDITDEPARIVPASGSSWPTTNCMPGNVQITYTAGYGDDATLVPQPIKQAMLLTIGHWYDNREATISGTIIAELPMGVEALLAPYRIIRLF